MTSFLFLVVCAIWFNCSSCDGDTYKAAIIQHSADVGSFSSIILEAAKQNVDILVVPSPENLLDNSFGGPDYYDQAVTTMSDLAKQGGIYVATHVLERARCQNRNEVIRTSMVFDRNGDIVSVYRKPVNAVANCTKETTGIERFTTDFGVQFGLLMEEDLVLRDPASFKDVKNFIMVGSHASEIPFLNAPQFSKAWTYATLANVISLHGIYSGAGSKFGRTVDAKYFAHSDLKKNVGSDASKTAPVTSLAELPSYPGEDLSQYIIKPLNLESSRQGYKETVCHGQFCCHFYVKIRFVGPAPETSYGLAAFSGIRHLGLGHYIGVDACAVFACAGLYKRSCDIGSKKNTTNTYFEKIIISSNFSSENSAQFPVILTTDTTPVKFNFDRRGVKQAEKVTVEIEDSNNLLSFGIFGRDFSKDYESFIFRDSETEWSEVLYEYFFNEDVQEFFDYLWIRIHVAVFPTRGARRNIHITNKS